MKKSLENWQSVVAHSRDAEFKPKRTIALGGAITVAVEEVVVDDGDPFKMMTMGPVVQRLTATRSGAVIAHYELQYYNSSDRWVFFKITLGPQGAVVDSESLVDRDMGRRPSDEEIEDALRADLLGG